nr:retrovirus-related Pol polyprotein from transposon TNT 1-94 [Tanacetum cinerariifolium]
MTERNSQSIISEQQQASPGRSPIEAALGHPKLGLWYPKASPFDLEAYSDSDYGGASQDRKSTTRGSQFLGRRLISWQCKKHTIVATSTTKVEYVAVASYCGQVLWIQNQLLDYGKHIGKTFDLVWIWLGGDYGNVFLNGFSWDSVINMCKNYLHGSLSEQRTHEFIHIYLATASVYVWIGEILVLSGTKDVASQDVKKDVSSLRYIALPNWFHEAHLESSTSNAQDTCNAAALEEPEKIFDALKDPSWVEAMQEEFLQFKIQNVWILVDCPKGVRPIGTKWVLKNKKDERWIVIRNKARLVAQGHTQEEGVGNKMHKAFLLLVRKFPLPEGTSHFLKKNATARRKVMPLPEDCTAVIVKKKLRITFNTHLTFTFYSKKDMDQQYPTVAKIPMLGTGKFEQWQFRMQQYLQYEHYALWEVIEFGDSYVVPSNDSSTPTSSTTNGETGAKSRRTVTLTTEDMQRKKNDATKKTKKNLRKQQYGKFRVEGSETLEQTFSRLQVIIGQLQFIGVDVKQDDLDQKFLTSLAPEWLIHTIVWRNRSDLDTMSLDDLYNHLKVYESEVQKKSKPNTQNMAFISSAKHNKGNDEVNTASVYTASNNVSTSSANVSTVSISQETACAYVASQSSGAPKNQDRGRRDTYRQGSKAEEHTLKALMAIDGVEWDWSYMANNEKDHALVADEEPPTEFALMANTCTETKQEKEVVDGKLPGLLSASKDLDNLIESQRSDKSKEALGYTVIPHLVAQLYLSPKKDLSWTGLPECADDTVTDYSRPSPTVEGSSEEDNNRNPSPSENVASPITPKQFVKFVKASDSQSKSKTDEKETPKKPPVKNTKQYRKPNKKPNVRGNQRNWNNLKSYHLGPDFLMKKKAYFNCDDFNHLAYECRKGNFPPVNRNISTGSRNFPTANKKFSTASRKFPTGSTKGPTADMGMKGKVVKPSVCWNSVMFTDSECIVLGRDFKLLDDANILLRTPRQHNMYSIDLNNIVPYRDLTCLVAKASVDVCYQWHRRLGKQHKAFCKSKLVTSMSKPLHTLHKDLFGHTSDETSGILRKLITEIENLKDLKVKIIRCDNGGEFRNKELNDFCSQKGIIREFSNARTPQLNGVAERRSRSLIEAARTMLADAKLPVTFWAEVVNTACYVQNRVLVNKAHNKTPYELFNDRTPAIGFFKPFGCHVMILITLDNLGKFELKGDEGYFLRYSMSSKAFRLFNKRTKRDEENVHIEFLENKAIEKGSGPNWLFDIDSLTESMNYVPVVDAGTNSTNFLGTKVDARKDVKKDVSSLRYIVLPNWVHEEHLESILSQPQDPCNTDAPKSIEPKKIFDALQDPSWVEAMQDEPLQFKIQNVWTLVDCPKGARPIRMKWVLKNKKDERGIVIRIKARLVAQGHTQEERIDYDEVFTPIAIIEAIRLFLAYASFMDFVVYQMDVKSAFLYGTIDEEVPDIMFVVCACAMHQVTPKECHLRADRKSITRGCQFLGRRLISWQWKKQTIVATSTTKAEYVAAASCCGQVLWIQIQLPDYGYNFMNTKIYIDNNSAICIVKNLVYHSKTKHIEIRHHFIRDCFEKKLISVDHIHTDENVSDLLTKPFDAGRFQYLVMSIGMVELVIGGFFKGILNIYALFGEHNSDFHPMVDFLEAYPLRYALMVKPTVYVSHIRQFWFTARIETTEEGTKILATVDGIVRTVSESSLRCNLKLRDEDGISLLLDAELFENLSLMGYNISSNQKFTFQKGQFSHQWKYFIHTIMQCLSPKSTWFNKFSSNIATALVCLATNRTYNFSKMIFDGLVKNINKKVTKFLMYPRFLAKCLRMGQFGQITHTQTYVVPFYTKKIFTTLRVNSPSFSDRIVPLFDVMLVSEGEGSGTLTEPHHTPSPVAQTPSHTTQPTSSLPSVSTTSIPTVTPTETTPIRQYTRRARIAQSSALPPVADEPASPVRDVSQGEDYPTDSGFIADKDRATIAKSFTLPHDSTPRVTSPIADGGSMQPNISELTVLCTNLQREDSELLAKFQAQEVEILKLKEMVNVLEDREGIAATRSGDDSPIKRRSMDEGEAATERISNDTEKMAMVLTSIEAAAVLAGGIDDVPTSSGFILTVGPPDADIPTSSDVVPTTSPVFATATVVTLHSRRKGKEVMVETDTLKKQRLQEQFDAQVARELEEQQEREDKRMSEQIARDAEVA